MRYPERVKATDGVAHSAYVHSDGETAVTGCREDVTLVNCEGRCCERSIRASLTTQEDVTCLRCIAAG